MKKSSRHPLIPAFREINFTQAAPVQNNWYEVLHVYNARIYGVCIGIVATGETLEFRITVDGSTAYWGQVAVNANEFSALQNIRMSNVPATAQALIMSASAASMDMSADFRLEDWLKGRDVLLEVRKITAAGAGNLVCRGLYGQE